MFLVLVYHVNQPKSLQVERVEREKGWNEKKETEKEFFATQQKRFLHHHSNCHCGSMKRILFILGYCNYSFLIFPPNFSMHFEILTWPLIN
jgi:hypothetical protein